MLANRNPIPVLRPEDIQITVPQYAYPVRAATGPDKEIAQIKACLEHKFDRFESGMLKDQTLCVVGYGPTLKDTWQQITHPCITVSGAHDFLLSKGIVPDYHMECDGRAHKVKHLTKPHPDVTYIMATTCHPKFWELLKGHKVKVWHCLGGQHTVNWIGQNDPYSLLIATGTTAGLGAIQIGGVMGYRKFKLFGIDNHIENGVRHAGPHAGPSQRVVTKTIGNRTWDTTPQMAVAADELVTLVRKTPEIEIQIVGDSMQADLINRKEYTIWDTVLKEIDPVWIGQIKLLDVECQNRRNKAKYNTGSISNNTSLCLKALSNHFKPNVVVEIGTFIGKSSLSFITKKLYTCDKDNDCLESSNEIVCHPYQTSTEMLYKLVEQKVKADMFFFDGRIQPVDIALILHLSTPNTVYVFDDYTGNEKGVINVKNLWPYLKKYVFYSSPPEFKTDTTLGLLIPEHLK